MVKWKPKEQIERARRLRIENATEVEKRLWQRLRAGQLGAKFRRQHPLGGYVLDFVCIEKNLVVELDGGQHADTERAAHDKRRTAFLLSQGLEVLRFWNNDVVDNMDGVLETIARELAARPSPPAPLSRRRARGRSATEESDT